MKPQTANLRPPIFDQLSAIDFERGQILNLNKPVDWTSFDVVKKVRRHTRVSKVGHAGTLDPFASGVLLVCTGKATKRVSELMDLDKEYVAEIELGKTTDTYDRTGTVQQEIEVPHLTIEEIRALCGEFVGEILQTPPMYSALKVNGQRLYKLARKGQIVEREPRRVLVHSIELLDFSSPLLRLQITCSKGTYVRALAHDLGQRIGCGAYLRSLLRARIGSYRVENAYSPEILN